MEADVAAVPDAAADPKLKGRGADVGAVTAGRGVLTARGKTDAPGVLPAVLVLAGVPEDVLGN